MFLGVPMEHYHIYRPMVFPVGSGRILTYSMVEISFESRTSANRYAREYDSGGGRCMVKQCRADYCAEREVELYADV